MTDKDDTAEIDELAKEARQACYGLFPDTWDVSPDHIREGWRRAVRAVLKAQKERG